MVEIKSGVIYKYPILGGTNHLDLPQHSVILSAGLDVTGVMCVWAFVYPDEPLQDYIVDCIGTGWEGVYIDPAAKFIGTVNDGEYIWHIFWRR